MCGTLAGLISCIGGLITSAIGATVTGLGGAGLGGISSYLFSGCGGIIESVLDAMGSF